MSTDSSGSNDPANCSGGDLSGDAAWLDIVWANNPSKYHRLQTVYAKHSKGVNVIYVDGHSARSLPSKLTWGQFYGKFSGITDNGYQASAGICNASFDSKEWDSKPE